MGAGETQMGPPKKLQSKGEESMKMKMKMEMKMERRLL